MAIWDKLLKKTIDPLVKESINQTLTEEKNKVEKGLVATNVDPARLNPMGRGSRSKPFPKGVKFSTLREFANYYPILRSCINYRKRQINQLDWDIAPKEVIKNDDEKKKYRELTKEVKEFFRYPSGDKSISFRSFVNKIIEDLLVLDAVAIHKRQSRGGNLYGYLPIDAATIELRLNKDGTTPVPPKKAYVQKINGEIKAELSTEELYYRMMNPRTSTPYGLSPVEILIIVVTTALKLSSFNLNYLCYDEKTEVLTKNGWKHFRDLTDEDVVATRNPEGTFEWQKPLKRVSFDYDDNLIRFKSRTVDLLVTPNHRMLVDYRGTDGKFENENRGLIKRADWFLDNPKSTTQNYLMPTTSSWTGVDPKFFRIPGYVIERKGRFSGYAFKGRDKDSNPIRSKKKFTTEEKTIYYKKPPIEVPIKDWLAFLGLYLAEGWVRAENKQSKHDVYISQGDKSEHLPEIKDLLARLPFNFRKEGADKYVCSDARLWQYLKPLGKSYEKYVPSEFKNYSSDLLKILWKWMCMGDGTKQGKMVTYTTTSKKLADDCQEIVQKIGKDARVYVVKQQPGHIVSKGKNPIKKTRLIYKVAVRGSKHRGLSCTEEEKYKGKVYSVKVPNGIVYVRRNGWPAWCGNTEGNVPEGFVELPTDIASNQEQLNLWQKKWDSMFSGDPRYQRKIKFLPEGMKWHPVKKQEDMGFDRFEKWLLLQTASVMEVAPQAIGFQFDRGKGATEAEWEIGKERGLFPLANFLKELFDEMIQLDLGKSELQFVWTNINPTNEAEEAKVFKALVDTGAVSVDEWRIGEGLEPIGCPHYVTTPVGPIFVKDLVERSEAGQAILPDSYTVGNKPQKPPRTDIPDTKKPSKGSDDDSESKPTPSREKMEKLKKVARDEIVEELKRWKRAATNDLKQGRDFRDFTTTILDKRTHEVITKGLDSVDGRDDLDGLFNPFINQETQVISAVMDLYDEVDFIIKSHGNSTT